VITLVRAEWLKLRTVVGNVVLLVLSVVLPIGFSVLIPLILIKDNLGDVTRNDLFGLALAGLSIAQALVGVIGVQLITQEFRFTLRPTFSAEPRRQRVMAAKAITITAGGMVIGAIAVPTGLLIGGSLLKARDFPFEYGGPGFWRATIGAVVVTAIYGLIGLGLGAVLRSPAAAITLYVVWVMLVEGIVYAVVPKVGQYAPFQAGAQLSSIEPIEPGLGALWGGLLFAAFAIVLVVTGTVLVTRNDA
jgi:ABC-2 type transport system permease protein